MQLHTPTLVLANLVIAVVMAVSMGLVASRKRRDGMVCWAWGMAVLALAYLLLGLRGQISDWLSVVGGNTLLVVTYALFAEGLCQFQHRRPRHELIWAPVLVMPLALSLLMSHVVVRSLLVNGVLAFQSLVMLQLVWSRRHETAGRGQYFVLAGSVMVMLMLLMRLAAFLAGQADLTQVVSSHLVHALSMLVSTLTVILVAMGLVLMSKERSDRLNRTMAMQDELTGLGNRRSIQRMLEQQLAMLRRSGRPLALLLIDVDHFKRVNDTHGHLSGDKALREIADCLQERVREQDVVGRWGGEEFIVLLPDTEAEGARKLAEQLRLAVEQLRITSVVGKQMPLTISIGLHALDTLAGSERDDMIGAADRALYLAKQNGRNRVEEL